MLKKIDKKPKAIIFDWDNTLVDTWPILQKALNSTLVKFDLEPWSMEEIRSRVHRSAKDSFPEVFGKNSEEAIKYYLQIYKEFHRGEIYPLQDSEKLLKKLKNQDIYLAIVSNKTGEFLRDEVKLAGWEHYFSKIIGSKDTDEDKPSIKPVIMAMNGSNINLDHAVWFIGDSIADMECAHNAHLTAVYFNDQELCHQTFKYCIPHIHVKNHSELINIIGD